MAAGCGGRAARTMNDAYDRQLAALQDLELLCADLIRVSAQLEELATAWRRDHVAGITTRELPLTSPPACKPRHYAWWPPSACSSMTDPISHQAWLFPPSPSWPLCMRMSQPPPMMASGQRPACHLTVPLALASGPASSTP